MLNITTVCDQIRAAPRDHGREGRSPFPQSRFAAEGAQQDADPEHTAAGICEDTGHAVLRAVQQEAARIGRLEVKRVSEPDRRVQQAHSRSGRKTRVDSGKEPRRAAVQDYTGRRHVHRDRGRLGAGRRVQVPRRGRGGLVRRTGAVRAQLGSDNKARPHHAHRRSEVAHSHVRYARGSAHTARYKRIAKRRGHGKAIVATAAALLRMMYFMQVNGMTYAECIRRRAELSAEREPKRPGKAGIKKSDLVRIIKERDDEIARLKAELGRADGKNK